MAELLDLEPMLTRECRVGAARFELGLHAAVEARLEREQIAHLALEGRAPGAVTGLHELPFCRTRARSDGATRPSGDRAGCVL